MLRLARRAALSLMLLAAATACAPKNIARPPVPEVPIREPNEAAPVVAIEGPKVVVERASDGAEPPAGLTAAPPPRDDAAEAANRDKTLPKLADACKKDDDCTVTNVALGGDLVCCSTCRPAAATKASVKKLEQACQHKSRTGKPKCPPVDCARAEVECRAGHCALK